MSTFSERWGTGQPKRGQPKPDQPGADKPLQDHINWYVQLGYRVVSQTEVSAQLVKPKQFSFIWALLLVLIYFFYYMSKKDETVYLTVGADGRVTSS